MPAKFEISKDKAGKFRVQRRRLCSGWVSRDVIRLRPN